MSHPTVQVPRTPLDPATAPLVLVCAADNRYALGLGVAVLSALVNLQSSRPVELFILDGGIRARNRRYLETTLRSRATLHWLTPDQRQLQHLYLSGHITIASYLRLLIAELLPATLTKAIYLDSDVIVQGDLGQLWELPLEDQFVLAVRDLKIPTVSSQWGLLNYQELGLAAETGYFNSGVLVINLEQWRQQEIARRAIAYLQTYRQYVRWHDQDALNAIFAGQWGELDPHWNCPSILHRYPSWQQTPYSETVYHQLLTQPYIIHFLEYSKPWTPGFQHPAKPLFFHYLKQTAWPDWLVQLELGLQSCKASLGRMYRRFLPGSHTSG